MSRDNKTNGNVIVWINQMLKMLLFCL